MHRTTAFGLLALAGTAACAHAQPAVWNVGSGSWNTPANWLAMNVPDTATETAVLGGAAGYTVDLNLSPSILAIEITNAAATLSLNAGRTLTIQGASINDGMIDINPQGSATNAFLGITTNPVTLTGTGQIRMLKGGDDAQILSLGGGVLTNGAGHTIRGVGQLGAILDNQGAVVADASISLGGATLVLSVGAKANSGTISAASGSTLAVQSIGITQTPLGQMRPDGGTITFASSSLAGGEISGTTTFVSLSGTNTFTGVTLNAQGEINASTVLAIGGSGLTNNATLGINPQSSTNNAVLRFDQSGLLGGTGEVHMLSGNDDSQITTAIGATITQGPDHAIRGAGRVVATLVNDGEVWADEGITIGTVPTLVVATNPITNNNVIGAKADSNLQMEVIPINQTGGGELRAESGTLTFVSTGLTGGSIESTGTGQYVIATGTNTFTGVTANAPGQVNAAAVLAIAGVGLTNNNVLLVNPQSSASNAFLRFDANGTLGGTGEVRLVAGPDDSQLSAGPGITMVHAPGHTIRGGGTLPSFLDNQGTIIADPTVVVGTPTILLSGLNKANSGLVQADTGGTVTVSGITVDQGGGGVLRVNGGTITLTSATLLGGQIAATASGGEWTVTAGTNTFTSVVNGVTGQVNAGSILVVNGSGLTNNADITINPQSSASNAFLTFNQSGMLGGAGRVILFAGVDDSQITAPSGVTVTHGSAHSIVGEGTISMAAGAALANQGLIAPGPIAGGVGQMAVNGTVGHTGVLDFEIAGNGTANYDRFTGAGAYTLGGTLDLSLIGGYVPARQHNGRIIAGGSVTGRFATVIKPALPAGVALRVVYLSNAVEVWFHCPPDFTTGAIPGAAGYGVPNGTLNNDDFFFYLSIFAAGDPDADLTTGAIPGSPNYGVPNGLVNNDDFFYYLALFAAGC